MEKESLRHCRPVCHLSLGPSGFNPQPALNSMTNSCQQPFTPSLDDSQSSNPSLSLAGSFPDLNLDGDLVFDAPWEAYKYRDHQSDRGITDFPYDNPSDFDGQSTYYPSL